jgi:transcription initiation factor IIE alpha subunit
LKIDFFFHQRATRRLESKKNKELTMKQKEVMLSKVKEMQKRKPENLYTHCHERGKTKIIP